MKLRPLKLMPLTNFTSPLLLFSVCVGMSLVINHDKLALSEVKGIIHSLGLAILCFGLLRIAARVLLVRILLALLIGLEFFLQLTYQTSMSVSIVMSLLNAPMSEAVSFINQYGWALLLALISMGLLITLPIRPSPLLTVTSSALGLGYLLIPLLLQLPGIYRDEFYVDYLNKGTSRGHSTTFSQIEYSLHKLSPRFPMFTSVIALLDSATFLGMQIDSHSSWQQVSRGDNAPHLLVLGIGESLRAANLSLYGYERNTTPQLASLQRSQNLQVFNQVYAAGTNTWNSVPAIMTHSQDLPDMSKSIIHLAKDAGYETFWLSNQAALGQWDFSITSLANQADHQFFVSTDAGGSQYDEVLIPELASAIASSDKPKLIVLHFYGSHMTFSDRYPAKFAHFNSANSELDQYDNSVLYTDYIQQQIINLVTKHKGQYLYFADHGLGEPNGPIALKHDVRTPPDIDSLRVPMFTTPSITNHLNSAQAVPLFHFECIFTRWADISAKEISDNNFCEKAINAEHLTFLDANMKVQTQLLPAKLSAKLTLK